MSDVLLSAPASPGADSDCGAVLPPEVLALIFAHADPATLLVSLRALSRTWRTHIDAVLLPALFAAGTWRVGLQVTRKPRFGRAWRGTIVGPPAAAVAASTAPAPMDAHEAAALAARLRSIPGVREDELPDFPGGPPPQPLTHVIPLAFTGIAADGLSFATPKNTYHALFEPPHAPLGGEPDAARDEAAANALRDARREARLDLDFAVVWRFPGDGGEGEWDTPDNEGGWISRFYCSHHDVSEPAPRVEEEPPLMQGLDPQVVAEEGVERAIAYSTPVARRTRAVRTDELGERLLNAERSGHALDWDDSGMEYGSFNLSLGPEFFGRRSARSNRLLRLLQAEAFRSSLPSRGASPAPGSRGSLNGRPSATATPSSSLDSPARSGLHTPLPSLACPTPAEKRPPGGGGPVGKSALARLVASEFASPGSNNGASGSASAGPSNRGTMSPLAAALAAGSVGAVTPRSGARTPIRSGARTPSKSGARTPKLRTPSGAHTPARATFEARLVSAEDLVTRLEEEVDTMKLDEEKDSEEKEEEEEGSVWRGRTEYGTGAKRVAKLRADAGVKWSWQR